MVTQLLVVKNEHNYIHIIKRVQYASNTRVRSVQYPHPVSFNFYLFFKLNRSELIIFFQKLIQANSG